MSKYAVLISSQLGRLRGTDNDVEAMARRLRAREFDDIDIRTGARATCAGIREGIQCSIDKAEADDVVVIYFAGHGTRVHNPRYQPQTSEAHVEPRLLACLVPTDWREPGFHGLLDRELSYLLAALSKKTKNVSLILDCCYSARMGKGEDEDEDEGELGLRVRALGVTELDACARVELAQRLDEFDALERSTRHPSGNVDVVRLVGAEADSRAHETQRRLDDRYQPMGVMTWTLVTVLDELEGERVTWRSIALMVRERVLALAPSQRPEIEGPSQRYFLELATAGRFGAVPYYREAGRPALRTSRLLGAEIGAVYALMPPGHDRYDERRRLGLARVTKFVPGGALVTLEDCSSALPRGTLAFPLHLNFPRQFFCIRSQGPQTEELALAFETSPLLASVPQGAGARLELIVDDGIELRRATGELLCRRDGPDAAWKMRDVCERWAKAEALRELEDGDLALPFELSWGRFAAQKRFELSAGELLHDGDALYIDFVNSSDKQLFFSVIDIGVDGTICLVTRSDPVGRKLEPGERYPFGLEHGEEGLPLSWPDEAPREAVLLETVLVLVSSGRHELRSLENGPPRAWKSTGLESVLAQIGMGAARGSVDAGHPYAVHRIDFWLSPERRVSTS